MRLGEPSTTARLVAAYRLGFERVSAAFGDPAADQRLCADVADGAQFDADDSMARHLRGRTLFFDSVVVEGLGRGVSQVVVIGAGYDGRALRYAKPGVRWFEVDQHDTQRDKQERLARIGARVGDVSFIGFDLREGGLAARVMAAGFRPEAESLLLCEGVAVYLESHVLSALLQELRWLACGGTRLAISVASMLSDQAQLERRGRLRAAVMAVGEPMLNGITAEDADALLAATGWRAWEVSSRARRAGLVLAVPEGA